MNRSQLLAYVQDPEAFMDELCRRDFVSFVLRAFPVIRGGPLKPTWHFDAVAYALEDVTAGRIRGLVVTLPPRHLKSILISVMWVAWRLGHDPALRFVCVSYSGELSTAMARDCRTLMQSALYHRIFPGTRIRSSRSAAYDYETTASGCRLSTSITGTLTGRGGDYIIVDDAHKPDEVTSDVVREAVVEWFFSTLSSRLDQPTEGAIILVMQRLHQYDLAGMLIERGWPQLSLPAIATARTCVPLTRGRLHVREEGEPLAPSFCPLEELHKREQEIGSRLFAAQYQQDPVPAKGNIVKAHWLLEYDHTPDRSDGGIVVQSWDTAAKAGESNDFSVCVTALVKGRKVHVLDVWRQKVQFSDLWKASIELARRYDCQSLLVEETSNGTALIERLRNESPTGVPSPIARRPKLDKQARLEAASSMMEAGDLSLPKDASWLATFKSELLGFPSTRYDDQVDALSQLMNWVDERQRFPPVVNAGPELIEEDYDGSDYDLDDYLDAWTAA